MILTLSNNYIEIWQADLNEHTFIEFLSYFHILSKKENSLSFKIDHQRKIYILSRIILRFLLSKYTGISPELIKIYRNEYGKSFIKSANSIKFNISHSKDKLDIAIALSEIDIEYINPSFDIHEVMNMALSKNEKLGMRKLEPKLQKKKILLLLDSKRSFTQGYRCSRYLLHHFNHIMIILQYILYSQR